METLKVKSIRDARIEELKFSIGFTIEGNMETLGFEKLGLENQKSWWDHESRQVNRVEGSRAGQGNATHPRVSGGTFGQDASKALWPPMNPSYELLSVPPIGSSANVLNPQPQRRSDASTAGDLQNIPSYQLEPDLVAKGNSPNVSRYVPGQGLTSINGSLTDFNPATKRSIHTKPRNKRSSIFSKDCHGLAPPLYSQSKPLPQPKAAQRGRWTSSPPGNLGSGPPTSKVYEDQKAKDLVAFKSPLPASRNQEPLQKFRQDALISVPAPIPSPMYLILACASAQPLPQPQRLLLVLDLNGTLLWRPKASTDYTPRLSLNNFLEYALENHSLLIWSSAKPYNVKGMCRRLFTPGQRQKLLGEWARDTLGLTSAQYKTRVQVYKRLDRIWESQNLQYSHPDFNKGGRWGQHNTLLIDDSVLKASAQPFNHIEISEFVLGRDESDVLGQVVGYLEEVRRWSNASAFVREKAFRVDSGWKWDWKGEVVKETSVNGDNDKGGVKL